MAAAKISSFWFRTNDDSTDADSRKTPASPSDIDETEAHTGRRLPEELKALLMIQDGGVSAFSAAVDGERYFPLPALLGAGPPGFGTIRGAHDFEGEDEIPTGILVFAAGGHDWMGLDYRAGRRDPAVVYQLDEDSPIEQVAPTFASFLEMLIEE